MIELHLHIDEYRVALESHGTPWGATCEIYLNDEFMGSCHNWGSTPWEAIWNVVANTFIGPFGWIISNEGA